MKKAALFTRLLPSAALPESLLRAWSATILFLGILAGISNVESRFAVIVSLSFVAALIIVTRWNWPALISAETRKIRLVCLLSIVMLSLGSYLWALTFDSIQISDFGVYFRCGTEKHVDVHAWIISCQSRYLNPNLIYWSRSLLYSIPFGLFSGPNYDAFKLYNASFHAATVVLWFFGLRHYYGSRIAIIATLILALYPEWWFTTTLVTSDNAAIFFVSAFLLLLPLLQKNSHHALIIFAISLTMFSAGQSRSIGPILVATLALWIGLAQLPKWDRLTALKGVTALALYVALNFILALVTPFSSPDSAHILKYLSAIDFSSLQDFSVNYQWAEHFWPAIPPESRSIVGWNKTLLEISWGFDQLPFYLYKKAAVFFSGSGYYVFSAFQFGPNEDTVFTVAKTTIPYIPGALPWMTMAVSFCAALSFFSLLKVKLHGPALAAVIWLSAFTIMVLGLGEVQPRYSVLIAPALSVLAALALFPQNMKQDTSIPRPICVKTSSVGIAFLLLAGIFFIVASVLKFLHSAESMPSLSARISPSPFCAAESTRLETSYKRVRVIMPKGVSCAAISIPFRPVGNSLTLFASGTKFPFRFEPRELSPFHYNVIFDEKPLLESSLGHASVKWHRLDLPSHGASGKLVLLAQRQDTSDENLIDFWFLDSIR